MTLSESELDDLAQRVAARIKSAPMPDSPMTVKEAATALRVSCATIYTRIKAGQIPTIPGYGRCLILRSHINLQLAGK